MGMLTGTYMYRCKIGKEREWAKHLIRHGPIQHIHTCLLCMIGIFCDALPSHYKERGKKPTYRTPPLHVKFHVKHLIIGIIKLTSSQKKNRKGFVPPKCAVYLHDPS